MTNTDAIIAAATNAYDAAADAGQSHDMCAQSAAYFASAEAARLIRRDIATQDEAISALIDALSAEGCDEETVTNAIASIS